MTQKSSTLELRRGLAGERYYLEGKCLNGGDIIQLCFSGGWLTGRFEWHPELRERPRFHCSIELSGGEVAETALEIPERALVRWP